MKKTAAALLLLVVTLPASLFSATPATATATPTLEADRLRRQGWDAAYRTDFATARAKFEELQRLYPTHPLGDLSLASLLWQEYLFRVRRLQSNVFRRTSTFYSGASGSGEAAEGDSIDPDVDAAFERIITRALTNAQTLVDANPNDPHALYFLGACYGVQAAYDGSAKRRFWAALRGGLRAVKWNLEVIRRDPSFYDSYLAIGTYHYVVGSVPQPFRAIAALAGIRGGRAKGIAELELAMNKGTFNRDDSRTVLIALYRYEGHPQRALRELETMAARYPENVPLLLERAATLVELHRPAAAFAVFEELLRSPDRRLIDLVHFSYGESLAQQRSFAAAAHQFTQVGETPHAFAPLAAEADLRAGQMFDLAGNRSAAVKMYRAFLARPSASDGLRRLAERLIERPFTQR